MIEHKDIREFHARYHRNGVAGAGFFLCEFLFVDGETFAQMRAVVFEANGHVAVLSDSINSRWHGDQFEIVLRDSIERAKEKHPEEVFGWT